MANVIQVKRNVFTATGNPVAANLAYGELGWNNANGSETAGKLWIGQQTGTSPVVIAPKLINKSIAGVSNEVNVTESANSFTVGLPDDVTIGDALTVTGAASVGANLTVTGNLTVNGTTTTVNSTTVTVDDKNIELGSVAVPSDTTADGGGITLLGANDKTILYSETGDKWVMNKPLEASSFIGDITGAVTGNADTATTLATARNIGGVSFNGSANIDLPGVNSGGNQATTGNAATATVLATARNIGGVSFNGSANIDLPGVNSAGNQNTSGEAATLASSFVIDGGTFS